MQTTREQPQQQRFFQNRLTPMECPHLLSHEMTGQVDSRDLDPCPSSPHVVSYPAVVSSCLAELCFVLGKDGLRYRLRTPCNSEHSVFIEQYSNKRTTCHSATELVSRRTSHTAHEEIGTTFNTGLSNTSRVEFASGKTLPTSLENCYTSWVFMSCSTFHSKFLLANGIDLHLHGTCDTVQANRDIRHTNQQRDKRVGFQFPLIISTLVPQYTNCSVLSCHVHQLRGVARCTSKDRAPMRWRLCKRHRSRSSRSER